MSGLSQKKMHEVVVQLLYSLDLGEGEREELIHLLMGELKVARSQMEKAYGLAASIHEKRELFDAQIGALASSYSLERIGRVEKNILRFAAWSFHEALLPVEVIVAEAIRLTVKFSTESAATFVQGVVNALYHREDASLPSP